MLYSSKDNARFNLSIIRLAVCTPAILHCNSSIYGGLNYTDIIIKSRLVNSQGREKG